MLSLAKSWRGTQLILLERLILGRSAGRRKHKANRGLLGIPDQDAGLRSVCLNSVIDPRLVGTWTTSWRAGNHVQTISAEYFQARQEFVFKRKIRENADAPLIFFNLISLLTLGSSEQKDITCGIRLLGLLCDSLCLRVAHALSTQNEG